jgi:hypothetical protein
LDASGNPIGVSLASSGPAWGGHAIDLGIGRRDFKTGPISSISPFLAAAHTVIPMNAR